MTETTDSTTSWRHYTIRWPISTCSIQQSDLKRLYDTIDEKQREEAKELLAMLSQLPNESIEQFEQRKTNVQKSLVTLVSIAAPDGETVTGNTRDIFESAAVPERIQSILIDTSSGPRSLNFVPRNRVSLFLDFRTPTLLNYGVMPSAPTANESNYEIIAASEPWATALNTRLRQFFAERGTVRGWIHKQGSYDALLMFIGLPLTLWECYRIGPLFIPDGIPSVLVTAIYVYLFFLMLNIFRILFSYTRWVFPVVELDRARVTSIQRHRLLWYAIIIAIAGNFVTDAIKVLMPH